MKTDAWMPFYVADFIGDTTHLSAEETGAYAMLLLSGWLRDAKLPDDDVQLARMARMPVDRWRQIRPTLEPFFAIEDGAWVQRRLQREKELAMERHNRRVEAGRRGGRPTGQTEGKQCLSNASSPKKHWGVQPQPQPQPQPQEGIPTGGGVENSSPKSPPTPQPVECPTLSEVLANARLTGVPEDVATLFWHHYESNGWVIPSGGGAVVPIRRWEARLQVWKANQQAREFKAAQEAAQRGGKAFWEAVKRLELVEEELKKLLDACPRDAIGSYTMSQQQADRLKTLRGKRRELRKEVGLA